jgi:hypothetical protein
VSCRVTRHGSPAVPVPAQARCRCQVQTKHRFIKCSNTKIHSFKVTTHKENARFYIGGEAGINDNKGGAAPIQQLSCLPRAGRWSGSCPCRVRVLGFQPNTSTGVVPCQARTRDRSCRVVLGLCLNGPCLCRPNGLSPFGHLYVGVFSEIDRKKRSARATVHLHPPGRHLPFPPPLCQGTTVGCHRHRGGRARGCTSLHGRRGPCPVCRGAVTNRSRGPRPAAARCRVGEVEQ